MPSDGIYKRNGGEMKNTSVKAFLCVLVVLMAMGCAVPLGQNFSLPRETAQNGIYIVDYNLQTYVPIPVKGEQPVISSFGLRGDVNVSVSWFKDNVKLEDLSTFEENTVYSAKIELTALEGYCFNPVMSFSYNPGRVVSQEDNKSEPTRTISVTYNNSNYEEPVTDYNLQGYVPIPTDDEKAVIGFKDEDKGVKGTVQWSPGKPAASVLSRAATMEESAWTFTKGEQYTAKIIMEALPGWYFTEENFIYPDGVVQTQPSASSDRKKRELSPVYHVTVINIFPPPPDPGDGGGQNPDPNNPDSNANVFALDNYITAPSLGAAPNHGSYVDEYHLGVAVAWDPANDPFASKPYTANITVTADDGYTLGRVSGFTYQGKSIPFIFENNGAVAKMSISFPKLVEGNLVVDLAGTITPPQPTANIDFSFHPHGGLRYTANTVSWSRGYAKVKLMSNNYKAEIENTAGTGTGWIPVPSEKTFKGGWVYRVQIDLTALDEGWFNEVKEFILTDKNATVWDISFTTGDNGNTATVIVDFDQLTMEVVVNPGDSNPGDPDSSGGSGSDDDLNIPVSIVDEEHEDD
jgi:hypothetical protein